MTDDKHSKRAARELAARDGISYTAARRRLADDRQEHQEQERPPIAYPMAGQSCPEGCDGSGHRGTECWVWRSADVKNRAVRWEVRRAAELPGGRADQVMRRAEEPGESRTSRQHRFHAWETRWLLALVYAMLTDQDPGLLPDRAALRAAVEADDLAAVDALMEPLDRAAARLFTKVPDRWWGEVKPRLDAYADAVESDTREPSTWREVEAGHVVARLVDRWRQAWTPVRNGNGYMDAPGVMWLAPKGWLDALLVARHGGLAPHGRAVLADGRPVVVYAVEWGEAGPPVAYRVRELVPGEHGNVGKLVPSLHSDELVAAADCRSDDRPPGRG